MKPSQFAVLVFGAALCLLVGVVLSGCGTIRDAVGDLLSVSDYAWQVRDAERQRRELEATTVRVLNRLDRKEQVLDDLLQGRRTLLETARAFKQIDEDVGLRDSAGNVPAYRCATDECYARTALNWATTALYHRPGGEQTLRCLEAELDDLIRNGTLRP